jgi:hypothetical protein
VACSLFGSSISRIDFIPSLAGWRTSVVPRIGALAGTSPALTLSSSA